VVVVAVEGESDPSVLEFNGEMVGLTVEYFQSLMVWSAEVVAIV
jgi:hypothetical protein